tara:strand:+ start:263 stop:394 length:132 start_codon:yes stop_codon:yes gene_type:complete
MVTLSGKKIWFLLIIVVSAELLKLYIFSGLIALKPSVLNPLGK